MPETTRWWVITVMRDQIVPIAATRETTQFVYVDRRQSPVGKTRLEKGREVFRTYADARACLFDERFQRMQRAREEVKDAERHFRALQYLPEPPTEVV
jgi:hypothetical protein